MPTRVRIGVDTGGTFTDLVLVDGQGNIRTHKVISTPDNPARAVLNGVGELLERYSTEFGWQPEGVDVVHGSTVATNALLEGQGSRTALITTAGFEDVLWIARQNRPELYNLRVSRPAPPLDRSLVLGVRERIRFDGSVMTALGDDEIARVLDFLNESAVSSVAICLLHSYANPQHEAQLAEAIRSNLPALHITVSSELLPEFREYERTATCIANASVAPRMAQYITDLDARLPGGLSIMASGGGRAPLRRILARPVETVLSGPAGGLLGAWEAARREGFQNIIAFDMGGTSTDVSLCNSRLPQTTHTQVGALPIRLGVVDIHSIGAGGGSAAWIDSGTALRVGPRSMGADPGPACYGRQQGELTATVTDAHVVLGNMPPDAVLAGSLSLDRVLAREAVRQVAQRLELGIEETALGILRIAEAAMTEALRSISVARGFDPRSFALLSFGGCGGLHAANLAESLGIATVIIPPHSGLLSAQGMLDAPWRYSFSQSLLQRIDSIEGHYSDPLQIASVRTAADELRALAIAESIADGVNSGELNFELRADLRYIGQSHELTVDCGADCIADFEAQHRQLYGYTLAPRPIELVTLRLIASHTGNASKRDAAVQRCSRNSKDEPKAANATYLFTEAGHVEASMIARDALSAGDKLAGPLIVTELSSTTLVPAGWSACVSGSGALLMERTERADDGHSTAMSAHADPVELEIFRHLFASIAEEMGLRLLRSAFSPNIKERGDFSCALFSGAAEMIAQAAHIPVHLGSMPMSVAAVLAAFPPAEMQPGDCFVVNDPFAGGTHLPDITVVAPVFLSAETVPRFFVANRAHHSDIGGKRPGSLPIASSIDDEGLRIPPTLLTRDSLEQIALASRTPEERRGDLHAQFAALHAGSLRLSELCERYGADFVTARAESLLDYTGQIMQNVLDELPAGRYSFDDYLDDDGLGTEDILIACDLTIAGGRLIADFSRSADQVHGPLNAVRAIAVSAVHYVMRCLAPADMPGNGAVMRSVDVTTRPGSIVDALYPAAVVGGNVETSQRIVDVLLGALAQAVPELIAAASCGSMNNITVGGIDPRSTAPFTYYETIAGGSGAHPSRCGESAVHTHMTNTLNTPVEALEHAYPLRIDEYSIRHGSGGSGQHAGGNGVVRRYVLEADAEVTLLTERRRNSPYGLAGGGTAEPGRNSLIEANGAVLELGGKAQLSLNAGDALQIETPGGGGWGSADSES